MQRLRRLARHDLLVESRKHSISSKLRQIPYVGPSRAARLIALLQTPHRFRTKRQLWAYSGLALEIHTSAEYCYSEGQLRRSNFAEMARRFERRSGSRSSMRSPVGTVASGTSLCENLCPLGQPEKAVGHQPQIEPWLTPYNR